MSRLSCGGSISNARIRGPIRWRGTSGEDGYYDEVNDFIPSTYTPTTIYGVITTGNKFSQFEEGVALKPTESGERFSDYRTLYVTGEVIEVDDHIGYLGEFYNVVQMSPEDTFNFRGYLLEKDKSWKPT